MQKWAGFSLISKHSLNINFLCIFFMNYSINEFEKVIYNTDWGIFARLYFYSVVIDQICPI